MRFKVMMRKGCTDRFNRSMGRPAAWCEWEETKKKLSVSRIRAWKSPGNTDKKGARKGTGKKNPSVAVYKRHQRPSRVVASGRCPGSCNQK